MLLSSPKCLSYMYDNVCNICMMKYNLAVSMTDTPAN